jgi:hypothetical protein
MTFKKFWWWWFSLGIILLVVGCNGLSSTPTAVSPTPSPPITTPEISMETAVAPATIPATDTPHPPATPVPISTSSPTPNIATPTSLSTPSPLSAAELQATIIARSPVAYTTVFIWENLAFLGYGKYLVILDISTPSQPTLVSKTALQNQIKRIQAAGDTVYVVLEVRNSDEMKIGLQIIDITDPANPSEQGFYRPEFLAVDAVVIGGVAHVVGRENRWDVVDVSNPNSPTKIGAIREEDTTWGCMGTNIIINGVKEAGGYLYLSSASCRYARDFVIIYDTSNPLNPVWIRSHSGGFLDVAYRDNYAYMLASSGGTFLRILDVSDQSKPGIVGDLSISRQGYSLRAGRVIMIDHYVYLASSEGLYIIDVIDRFQPTLSNTLYPNAYFNDIVEANGYIYLLDWDNGLLILDVSDPVNPVEIGKWQR